MGYSRRNELREIADCIDASNRAIEGVTLGAVRAGGTVILPVACHTCPRRGRYRVTRLIDRYSAAMPLSKLERYSRGRLPEKGRLVLQPVRRTLPQCPARSPLGFVVHALHRATRRVGCSKWSNHDNNTSLLSRLMKLGCWGATGQKVALRGNNCATSYI